MGSAFPTIFSNRRSNDIRRCDHSFGAGSIEVLSISFST